MLSVWSMKLFYVQTITQATNVLWMVTIRAAMSKVLTLDSRTVHIKLKSVTISSALCNTIPTTRYLLAPNAWNSGENKEVLKIAVEEAMHFLLKVFTRGKAFCLKL